MSATFPSELTYTKLNATNTVLTGAAGKRIMIWELLVAPAASTTLNISDETGSLSGSMTLTGLFQNRGIAPHWVSPHAGEDVTIAIGADGAGQVVWSLEN